MGTEGGRALGQAGQEIQGLWAHLDGGVCNMWWEPPQRGSARGQGAQRTAGGKATAIQSPWTEGDLHREKAGEGPG